MTRTLIGASSALLAVLAAGQTLADDQSQANLPAAQSAVRLPTITVTGTRIPTLLSDAPGSLVVVPQEEAAQRAVTSFDRVLQTSPGVLVTEPRGLIQDTTYSNIVVRGIPEQKRTLFMIDGVPINNPFLGRFFGGAPDDLEQVELLKGGASALWGGNALAGVVNNITRQPAGREFTASLGYGSALGSSTGIRDRRNAYLSYGDRFFDGKVSVFTSLSYDAANNYPTDQVTSTSTPPGSVIGAIPSLSATGGNVFLLGNKGNLMSQNYSATFKLTFKPTDEDQIKLAYFRTHLNYHFGAPDTFLRNSATGAGVYAYGASVTQSNFLGIPERLVQDIFTVAWERWVGETQIKVSASVVNRSPENGYITPSTGATTAGGGGVISNSPSTSYRTDLQIARPIFDRNTLTVGASFLYDTVNFSDRTLSNWLDSNSVSGFVDRTKGNDRTASVFVQDKIDILPQLSAYLGARGDFFQTFGGSYANTLTTTTYATRGQNAFSPKFALVYKPIPGLTLRSSVGTGFRPPTVFELYTTTKVSIFTFLPNANLKPETAVTWDVGGEYELASGAKLSAAYFGSSVNDMIYNKTTGTTFALINAGHVDIQGFEMGAETPLPVLPGLKAFANYTFTQSRIGENSAVPLSVGKQLVRVPRDVANAGLAWQDDQYSAALYARYASKRYANDRNLDTARGVYGALDPYVVADLSLGYQVNEALNVQFVVNNLLNQRYFDSVVGTGRSWFLRGTMHF